MLPGVQPSRGCTEPAAIALATALAARAATGTVRAVAVHCDRNILKNAQAPGLPGTGGRTGAALAAALGAVGGDPAKGLEALSAVCPEDVARAEALVAEGSVQVELHPADGPARLWIEARVTTDVTTGIARLEDTHARVVLLEAGGEPVPLPAWASGETPAMDPSWEGASFATVLDLADALDPADAETLLAHLRTNLKACGADDTTDRSADPAAHAEAVAERGSVARMTGQPVTVVTSGFSGNQGLVASIPVWAVAQSLGASDEQLAHALAISHLTASYVRSFTGIVSPLCNAVQAASAGAAAACAKLLGGDAESMARAAKRVLATSGGVVCDGAKPACSLKVGLGASLAIRSAQRVVDNTALSLADGIAAPTLEETARNLGRLAHPALQPADAELLRMVLDKTSSRSPD